VIAVGGTDVVDNGPGGEQAWQQSGSSCVAVAKPGWQIPVVPGPACTGRATADVSAAAINVETYSDGNWMVTAGTSLATPIIAAAAALTDRPAADDHPPDYLYANAARDPSLIRDITTGPANGSCGTALCVPGPGWDGPTGLGVLNGTGALQPPNGGSGMPKAKLIRSRGPWQGSTATEDGCLGVNPDGSVDKTSCTDTTRNLHWQLNPLNTGNPGLLSPRARELAYQIVSENSTGRPAGCLAAASNADPTNPITLHLTVAFACATPRATWIPTTGGGLKNAATGLALEAGLAQTAHLAPNAIWRINPYSAPQQRWRFVDAA
jgi:hypothetical protein